MHERATTQPEGQPVSSKGSYEPGIATRPPAVTLIFRDGSFVPMSGDGALERQGRYLARHILATAPH